MEFSARRGVSRFSVLCGFVTMDLYWLYLVCLSHVINPVSVFVVDAQTGRHLQSGQIGSLMVTLAWSEVRLATLAALIVFALATLVADAGRKMLASAVSEPLALATTLA
jgi:hypothetical protein